MTDSQYLFDSKFELSPSDFTTDSAGNIALRVDESRGIVDCGIVYFYWSECGWCRKSVNDIIAAAKKNPHAMVKVYSCRSDENIDRVQGLTGEEGIVQSFPTIHYFEGGSGVMSLRGTFSGEDRTAGNLTQFLIRNNCSGKK